MNQVMSDQNEQPEWKTREYWELLFGVYRDERIDEGTRNILPTVYWLNIGILGVTAIYYFVTDFSRPVGWFTLALILGSLGQYWWLIGRHQIEEVDEYSSYIKRRQFAYLVGTLIWFPLVFLITFLVSGDSFLVDYLIWTAITVIGWIATPVAQLSKGLFPRSTVIFTIVLSLLSGAVGFLVGFYETIPEWGVAIIITLIFISCGWIGYRQIKKRPW